MDLSEVPKADWIQMFNGKDLDGWVKKVRTHSLADAEAFATRGYRVKRVPGGLQVALPERSDFRITLSGLDGRPALSRTAEGGEVFLPTAGLGPGVHVLGIRRGREVHRIKVALTGG